MRIVFATPIFPPEIGGPANYTYELAHRLRDTHHITVVALADNAPQIERVHIVTVSKKSALLIRLVTYFFVLKREAKDADVIYVQNAVAAGLPAALVGMLLGKPVVLKYVGDEAWERATQAGLTKETLDVFLSRPIPNFKIRIFFKIQNFVLNRVSKVMPPSQFLGDILATRYHVPVGRVEVNFNPVEHVAEPVHALRSPHQISVACRLVAWKHVDGIIRAVHELREKFPDAKLMIAGDGPERPKLEALVSTLHAGEHVTFLGRISQAQARELQATSSAHVLNSTYEGLPFEVLNSFAVGTPVVATNIGGTNELVLNEKTGLLIPTGDDAALVAALTRLFTDPTLVQRLTESGAEFLKEKFTWEVHIQKLLAVFTQLKQS